MRLPPVGVPSVTPPCSVPPSPTSRSPVATVVLAVYGVVVVLKTDSYSATNVGAGTAAPYQLLLFADTPVSSITLPEQVCRDVSSCQMLFTPTRA